MKPTPVTDNHVFSSLSTAQVVIRITVIIAVCEFIVMLILGRLQMNISHFWLAAFDVALLTVLSTPCLYFWVIRPFNHAHGVAVNQIHHLAHTDPLTQLANRKGITLGLESLLERIQQNTSTGAVLVIDLDGFKAINDKNGHHTGDAILLEIAQRLDTNLRSRDSVGRLGGDEFMILLATLNNQKQISRAIAMQVANRLCHIIEQPMTLNGKTYQLSASVGIRLLGFDELDAETAIKDADTAMHNAKQSGKNCAVIYHPDLSKDETRQ